MNKEQAYTLLGILLALFLGALDQTIVATALPKIVQDLNGVGRYAWVATAYLTASTALVPIYGKLADMYSRKKIELWAISLFLLGSILCGLSGEIKNIPIIGDGMNQLIVFRAIQGVGGAGLFAMAFIVIADLFPPAERGKYQGYVGAVFGISSILGPWIGGLLTDYGSQIIPGIEGWRWVFYVNIPFGALALWFIITRMPELKPKGEKQKINYVLAGLLLLALVPMVIALQTDKSVYPWTSIFTLSLLSFSVIMLILFVKRSLRVDNPILDFKLFNNKVFSTSNICLFLLGSSFLSLVIFLPLFLVNVIGTSATKAGIGLIPLSLGVVTGSILSGQMVARFGHYKRWMLIGGAIIFCGVILLSQMTPETTYTELLIYVGICGIGLGPSFPLYTLAIQNAVDVRLIGQATSASQFFRQIGGAIGTAILGTILATSLTGSLSKNIASSDKALQKMYLSELKSTGGVNLPDKIISQYNQQITYLEKVNSENSQAYKDSLLQSDLIPASIKTAIEKDQLSENQIKSTTKQLTAEAKNIASMVEYQMKTSFSTAVTKVYFYVIFIVAAAWLATWFVPELILKKSNN
jgi:EmrB/QacA subfamily drug resistance transporter